MKTRLLALLAVLLGGVPTACRPPFLSREVIRVVYAASSGTILPERQWYEEYTITHEGVTFMRRGLVEQTQVSAGLWQVNSDGQAIEDLFAILDAVPPSAIRRQQAAVSPDGGPTTSYTVVYQNGKELGLLLDPGTRYSGGDRISAAVDAFLQSLILPEGAISRHKTTP